MQGLSSKNEILWTLGCPALIHQGVQSKEVEMKRQKTEIFILFCTAMNKRHQYISRVPFASTISSALLDLFFSLKLDMAKLTAFTFFMGYLNRASLSLHSSMNLSCSLSPFSSSKYCSVSSDDCLPVFRLKRTSLSTLEEKGLTVSEIAIASFIFSRFVLSFSILGVAKSLVSAS